MKLEINILNESQNTEKARRRNQEEEEKKHINESQDTLNLSS